MVTVKAATAGGFALALLVLAAAGCGGDGGDPAHAVAAESAPVSTSATPTETSAGEAAATDIEVGWAGRVIDWAILVGSAVEFVEANTEGLAEGKTPAPSVRGPVAKALRALADCGPYTEKEVGKPPSERLEAVKSAVESACRHYSAGAAAALDLLGGAGSHASALAGEWEEAWGKGDELIGSVAEELRDFQPANTRTLPERAGETRETRVEPEFGAVASAPVETDVEVRCWSSRDWRVLLGEMKRFTRGRIGEGTVGFAGYGAARAGRDRRRDAHARGPARSRRLERARRRVLRHADAARSGASPRRPPDVCSAARGGLLGRSVRASPGDVPVGRVPRRRRHGCGPAELRLAVAALCGSDRSGAPSLGRCHGAGGRGVGTLTAREPLAEAERRPRGRDRRT